MSPRLCATIATGITISCGRCHATEQEAFARGAHARSLGARGCVDCHGAHRVVSETERLLGPGGVCLKCHSQPGKAHTATVELHTKLREIRAGLTAVHSGVPKFSQIGMASRELERAGREANEALRRYARLVHTDDQPQLRAVLTSGRVAARRMESALRQMHELLAQRKRGAAAFGAFCVLTALTLWLRFRR
jgi:hypothetical protein